MRRASAGFTLVELLVALMVMAILAALGWQGVDAIVRTRDASERRLEQTLRLATVLAQWERDFAALEDSDAVPALSFDGATLRLTRRAEGGLQVIAWSLRGGAGGDGAGRGLARWAGPAVTARTELRESWLRSQQLQGGERGEIAALAGVDQWQIYFYRGNAWTNAQSSGDLAPAAGAAASAAAGSRAVEVLPTGVRVVLGFTGTAGPAGRLTRDVMLGPQGD